MTSDHDLTGARRRPRWRLIAVVLLAAGVAILAGAHLPVVRSRVLAWVVSRLAASGVRADVGRLDYNVLALTASIEAISLRAAESAQPFFAADRARVDLAWSGLWGPLEAEAIDIVNPRITIVRDAAGMVNLPAAFTGSSGGAGVGVPPIVHHLRIANLAIRYVDSANATTADASGLSLDLARTAAGRLEGRLTMGAPAAIRQGDRATTVTSLDGQLSFDGVALGLTDLVIEAPEGRVRLDGELGIVERTRPVDVKIEGDLDAGRLAAWIGLEDAPAGRLAIAGTIGGSMAAPVVGVTITNGELAWPALGALSVDGHATVAGGVVTVGSLNVRYGSGVLVSRARVELAHDGTSEADVRWNDVDLGRLTRAAPALPIRVAAMADGRLDLAWTGRDVAGGRGRLVSSFRALEATSGAWPVAGHVDVSIGQRQWSLSADQDVAGVATATARLAGRIAGGLPESTVGGQVTVNVTDLGVAASRLQTAGILPAGVAFGFKGLAAAVLSIGGTFGSPRAFGSLTGTDVSVRGIGPASIAAQLDLAPEAVGVTGLRWAIGANVLSGDATLSLGTRAIAGRFIADVPDLSSVAPWPPKWRPQGSAELSAMLGGTLDDLAADLTATSRGLQVAGQTIRAARAIARVANGIVAVRTLELMQDDGRLTATGHYQLDTRQYSFQAMGSDLVISSLSLGEATPDAGESVAPGSRPVSAHFDLRLEGDGSIDTPGAAGTVEFSALDWGAYRTGGGRLDLGLAGDELKIGAVLPAAGGRVEGTVDLTARRFAAAATLASADLGALTRPVGPGSPPADGAAAHEIRVTGSVSLQATAQGPVDDPMAMSVAVDLSALEAAVGGVPVRLERPAQISRLPERLRADDLSLRIGTSTLLADGELGGPASGQGELGVDLKGSLADFVPLVRLVRGASAFDASGAVDVRVRATGPLNAPVLTGRLTLSQGSIAADSAAPVQDLALSATYDQGVVDLTGLSGSWQGAAISGTARVPVGVFGDLVPQPYLATIPEAAGQASAALRVTSLTPAALRPFLDEATVDQIGGRIDATATLAADRPGWAGMSGDVVLEHAEVELSRVPLRQTQPTRLRLVNGRLDVVAWRWAGAGNRVDVDGYVGLAGSPPEINLGVAGAIDLRMLGVFVPTIAVTGQATLDVRAIGTADDLDVEGQVAVDGADIAVRDPRIAITDLAARATLSGNRLQIERATASANGGTLEAAGSVTYAGTTLTGGEIALTGRGLAVEIVDGLRTEIDADIALGAEGGHPAMTGRVTILRGDYRRALRLTDQLFAARAAARAAATPADQAGALDRVRLNVAVGSAEDLIVHNNYGRFEVGTTLALIGTVGEPALAGRVTLREGGEVFLGGQTYAIRRGTVDFVNPLRIEPTIDLSLETRVQRYDITLDVAGTPDTLEATLRSPGLSQQDVVSLLLTGNMSDESTLVSAEVAQRQLLMLLSGELFGVAGRAVGLDAVQVGRGLGGAESTFDLLATESDPSARLTLTKNLSRDVELIVSQSLRNTGDITWIATYRPVRRVELRATTDDHNSESYEFRHEIPFGGGGATVAASSAAASASVRRVSAVEVRDGAGLADDAVRDAVHMAVGDRFDFYRWQQDRDRLLDYFHDRDYLEARVAARRREVGPDAVILEYAITRGPRTTTRIEGATLPAGVRDEMRQAWAEAIFDGFLEEDIELIATRSLVDDGYLRAEVEATLSEPVNGEKTLVVRVAAGTRFDDRRLLFQGNDAVPASEIEAVVLERDVESAAWRNPAELVAVVHDLYRSRGHLAAEVTAEVPRFDGTTATLPIRIQEGSSFRIDAVHVSGAVARSADDVRALLDLEADDVFEPARLEPARRAVEREYLRAGFNRVRVSAGALVNREDSRVTIALDIVEGPQQVLSAVDVTGASVTSPGTIEGALKLPVGTPVDMTAIYGAQKRLYDTGVFQSVEIAVDPVGEPAGSPAVQPVRASVALRELPRYRLRYGFRAIDVAGPTEGTRPVRPGFVADLLNRNVLGRAVTAGIAGQLESDRWLGRGILSLPSFFGRPVVTNLFLTQSLQDFAPSGEIPFAERSTEVTVEQRFRPARTMSVTYGYSFSRKRVYELDPDPGSPLPPLDIRTRVARLTATYAWSTRDDPSNPTRGWFHSSGVEYGPRSLWSDLRFVRYLAQQHYFRQIGGRLVLASAFRLGAGRGIDQDLIPSEKFYAGGGTTVRGFAEQGLGGTDVLGAPRGGNGLLVANQEARVRLHRWFSAVGFLDAGNVFPRASDISFGNLEAGAGVGLRVTSPFAILRVDFGAPLTSRAAQPAGRWYFGIGQTF
jgi:outer membrane protein assembly factor BamA/autotransporter translocation and assembly factor TamB